MKRFTDMDDNEIICLYFNRDEKAVTETENKYGAFIFYVCFGILRQRQDSEECVNTVYKKLWDCIPPEKPDDLKAFIARLARTTAIDQKRTDGRYKRGKGLTDALDDYADILSDGDSVTDEVFANELAAILNEFLRSLPEKERVCFVQRYYFNRTVPEIVRQTHIPRSTVYMILEKVKTELYEKLSKEGYLS